MLGCSLKTKPQPIYPWVIKHGWLENPLWMDICLGKSLRNGPFSSHVWWHRRSMSKQIPTQPLSAVVGNARQVSPLRLTSQSMASRAFETTPPPNLWEQQFFEWRSEKSWLKMAKVIPLICKSNHWLLYMTWGNGMQWIISIHSLHIKMQLWMLEAFSSMVDLPATFHIGGSNPLLVGGIATPLTNMI